MSENIKLLIVDDEEDFLHTIAERMEMRGFDVTTATNGQDAIIATMQNRYDIALLDLKMPGLNGKEVLEILKRDHKYIEVIILTAHGSMESAFECSKLGAFGFLTKPYEFVALIDTIKDAYEKRLKTKFKEGSKQMEMLKKIPIGLTSLDILEEMRHIDDDEK